MSVDKEEWVKPCLHLPSTPTFSSEMNLTSVLLISDNESSFLSLFKVASSFSLTKFSSSCSCFCSCPASRSKPRAVTLPFLTGGKYQESWLRWFLVILGITSVVPIIISYEKLKNLSPSKSSSSASHLSVSQLKRKSQPCESGTLPSKLSVWTQTLIMLLMIMMMLFLLFLWPCNLITCINGGSCTTKV